MTPSETEVAGSETSHTPLHFGTIILAAFPFTNQTRSKQRPAVVISNVAYSITRPDVILMPVTSQLRASANLMEVWIDDWRGAGLLKPSAIKPVIATLEQSLVLKVLGHLSEIDQQNLRTIIHALIT
jgi:mRNA interferase MazF